jgi:ubiquinone/menaquinone biosynthesis C-methylase UbiE
MIQDMFGFTAALSASAQSGLLQGLLDNAPRSAAEHAEASSLDPRATALVLDVLVAYGVAVRAGDMVGPSQELVQFVARAPGGLAQTIAMWSHVPEFLRSGTPFIKMDAAREATYSTVVAALGRMFAPPAATLAGLLHRIPRRVLDIGCGSGVWSLAIGAVHRDARITGLDLPAVLEAFRARASELGLADRVDAIAGDVHEISIPRSFDLVVIANVLRIESPERARAIVLRAAHALEPGGQLLIIDALGGGTPIREQARSAYALHLGMRTEHGRVYSRATIAEWLRDADLHEVESFDLDDGPGALGAMLASPR